MALLTEEQIKEIDTMRFRFNEHHFKYELEKWNKKQQPSTQFEPDWHNAPCHATSVYLQSAWFDTHMKEIYRVTICGWGRPVTPHPHAEIMAKYAEVAARRVDPWVEFEFKHKTYENWVSFEGNPNYDVNYDFRHIGDNK